jgi:hypothetical protein
MKSIDHVLALWELGVLPSDAAVAWADAQIRAASQPSYELIELSLHGPAQCVARPDPDFHARPLALSFSQKFSVKAVGLDLSSEQDALAFAKWAAWNAIGEDLDDPVVMFGYRLDHLLDDCGDPEAAVQLLREALPSMIPGCTAAAIELFGQLPNNSSKPTPLRGAA